MLRSTLLVLSSLLLLVASAVHADDEPPPKAAPPAEQVASLAWLEGTWKGQVGPGTWEAVYTGSAGGEVLSTNKEIRSGRVVSFEFERFFVRDGKVVMTPYVKGVNEVAFTLTTCDPEARRAVFENPEHDFPQRIEYHRKADDQLLISVAAKHGERWSGFQLDLKRE